MMEPEKRIKISEILKELAKRIRYGNATVEFTFNRGKIVKAVIKEKEEIILVD